MRRIKPALPLPWRLAALLHDAPEYQTKNRSKVKQGSRSAASAPTGSIGSTTSYGWTSVSLVMKAAPSGQDFSRPHPLRASLAGDVGAVRERTFQEHVPTPSRTFELGRVALLLTH